MVSKPRDMIHDESNINIINSEVFFLTEHFAKKIQFCLSEQANESLFVLHPRLVKCLRSLDTTKNVAEKLQKSFLEIDFDLNNKFCDGKTYSVLGIIYCYLMKY